MNRNELQIIIDAQDRASKVLGRVRGQIDQTADRVRSLETTFEGIRNAGAVAFTAISAGIGLVVRTAGKMEQTEVAFGTMLGSAEKAKDLIGDIQQFGAVTPFESSELIQSSRALLAYGTESENIISTLKNVGDVASGTGTNITELATLFGKMRSAQVIYTEDLNQLAERGIPVLDLLAEKYDTNVVGIRKMASEGKLRFADIEEAFASMTEEGGIFFNMMNAQSQTLFGRISTLKDELNRAGLAIGETLLPIVGELVEKLIPLAEQLRNWIEANPELTKQIVLLALGLSAVLTAVGGLGLVLPAIIAGFSALLSPVTLIAGVIGGLLAAAVAKSNITLEDFGKWIQLGKEKAIQLKDRIVELYNRIIESPAFQLIVDQMRQIWFVITNEIIPVFVNFIKNLEPLKPVLLFLAQLFGTILVASLIGLTSAITGVVTVIGKVLTWSQELAEYLIDKFADALLDVQGGWEIVKEAMEPVIDKLKEVIRWAKEAARYLNPVTAVKGVYNAGKSVFGRANGGLVNAGQTYRVGERGPEMFTPQKSGRIVPNGGGLTVNITGNTFMGREDIAEQIGNDLLQVMKRENRI